MSAEPHTSVADEVFQRTDGQAMAIPPFNNWTLSATRLDLTVFPVYNNDRIKSLLR